MFDNNFSSTDPDKYYEVNCPVNYFGVSHQLKWFVSSINTVFTVEMFSTDDFITFVQTTKTDSEITKTTSTIKLEKSYKDRDESGLIADLNTTLASIDITLAADDLGRYKFSSSSTFSIVGMSYALQQTLGFYYKKDISTESPIECVEEDSTYSITAKAIGYNNLSPVWYLLSNLGSPNIVSSLYSPYESYYPSIAMKIMNQFSADQILQYTNSDFMSISQASALSNLRVKLVDVNLHPVKLLSPLFVTISFTEMAEEKQALDEAMAEQEPNNELKKQIEERRRTNYKNLTDNLIKRMRGVADEDLQQFETPKTNLVNVMEPPEDTRANEMATNVQDLNATTEQVALANDIHEVPNPSE